MDPSHPTPGGSPDGSKQDFGSRLNVWPGLWCALAVLPMLLLPRLAAAETETADLSVHNSRFVYSNQEKLGEFNLDLYLSQNAPWLQPYRELITHWSGYTTISPRMTLTLIELQSNLVSTDVPNTGALRRPFGNLSSSNTFNGQTEDVLRRLSTSFYGAAGAGQVRQPNAAKGALLALLGSETRLSDFHRSFRRIFPTLAPLAQRRNGFADPKATLPPGTLLQLPFPTGDSWVFNGAHSNLGRDPGPKSSIDFSSSWTSWGANTSGSWVVAAMAGTAVVHSRCMVEIISPSGWSTSYYHLGKIIVADGAFVRKDQRLGNYASSQRQALCKGDANGPHVHFSLLLKGEYVSLHDALLSTYRVDVGRNSYDSDCSHFWLERNGVRHCAGNPIANQSSSLPPPQDPGDLQAEALSNHEIELRWQDLSDTEANFEIERRQDGTFNRVGLVNPNTTVFIDRGLASGVGYDYRIRAVNDAGGSGYTNTATVTTDGERMPTDLTANTVSTTSIQLNWKDLAVSETEYEIETQTQRDDAFSFFQRLPADSESALIEGLSPQTEYTFRVRAQGASGVSTYSNEASATTFNEAPGPCESNATTLCLSQGRFRVEVDWQRFDGVRGDARRVTSGTDDSGLFWFFQDQNWEMLVKVLDGCGVNQHFWTFAAATTNVEYTLTVTDTASGVVKTYFNPLGTSAPAITDTEAFATCNADLSAPADITETQQALGAWDKHVPAATASDMDVVQESWQVAEKPQSVESVSVKSGDTSPCAESATRLCLNQGRFELSVAWQDFRGTAGEGNIAPLRSDDSGLFWFFNGNNWEMLAKILDGCAINDHYWVFAASTTNVGYRLTVRDTVTGTVRQYENPLGRSADAITDSEALAVCP